ncbi:hypothetical protein AGMMS49928_29200 [Spirochaetia bacterium]|nr:hypothetical protein AGMMS49928_29200 [Spirochaetia bacterium]
MKKILVVLLILATAGGLFAQEEASIGFGGWGRGVFVPFQLLDTDAAASEGLAGGGVNWGGQPSIAMTVSGQGNEKIGFQIEFKGDNRTPGIGDWAYVWVKPIEQIKLSVGRFNGDTLRGKFGDNAFHNFTVPMKGEDNIFSRFQPGNTGLLLDVTPIEGFYFGALIQDLSGAGIGGGIVANDAYDVYKNIQIGAGYTIEGTGQIRAQYIGSSDGLGIYTAPTSSSFTNSTKSFSSVLGSNASGYTFTNNQRIEAAFNFTGVEGLNIDLGGKYYLPYTESISLAANSDIDVTYQNPIVVALGAKYAAGDLSLYGRIDTAIGGIVRVEQSGSANADKGDYVEVAGGFTLNAHLIPEYKLSDTLTVGADIGFQLDPKVEAEAYNKALDKSVKTEVDKGGVVFGAGAYVRQDLGNGSLSGGLAFQAPTDDNGKTFLFSIPIVLEYSF